MSQVDEEVDVEDIFSQEDDTIPDEPEAQPEEEEQAPPKNIVEIDHQGEEIGEYTLVESTSTTIFITRKAESVEINLRGKTIRVDRVSLRRAISNGEEQTKTINAGNYGTEFLVDQLYTQLGINP